MTGPEVGMISTTGLSIGGSRCANQVIGGVTQTNSNGITGILSVLATREDTTVTFTTTASTFGILVAQADAGIAVQADVTTTTAQLYLDADYDNNAADTPNTVSFADGRSVSAKTLLTL